MGNKTVGSRLTAAMGSVAAGEAEVDGVRVSGGRGRSRGGGGIRTRGQGTLGRGGMSVGRGRDSIGRRAGRESIWENSRATSR